MNRSVANLLASAIVLVSFMISGCMAEVSDVLKKGDLIFVGLPMDHAAESGSMSEAISEATGDGMLNLIHVAIVDVDDEGEWIIDATTKRGVDRYPLDTFLCDFTLKDGSYPAFFVKRIPGDHDFQSYVDKARSFVGRSYNNTFVPNDTSMYCSELVRDCYVTAEGDTLFRAAPMNFKGPDGEYPDYWVKMFARLGIEIPQDMPGTNPQDMSASDILMDVAVDITRN